MIDDEPRVEKSKRHGSYDKEVHRCHAMLVIAKEGRNASRNECQETERVLDGGRDTDGAWGRNSILNFASATEHHDM